MARVITQETFNDAVQENVDDLGLTLEEAIQETIQQFEAQKVDLSKVSTAFMQSPADLEVLKSAVKNLGSLNKNKKTAKEFVEQLQILRIQCDKGIQYKLEAAKAGAYDEILITLKSTPEAELQKECFRCLFSLMSKQPDLLEQKGIEVIVEYTKANTDPEVKKLCLKWARECCILHELNRQHIYDAKILDNLKVLLSDANSEVLKEVLSVLRALILDDDVRVEFGRAHEHARGIASETLCAMTALLTRFKNDESIINELILTLSTLLVRSEFCIKVEEAGGLDLIRDVMTDYVDNEKINRQCFKLLKALGGNDECKAHIIQKGIAANIIAALNKHEKSAQTSAAAMGCIAALTLRSPDNSKAFLEAGAPEAIIESMKLHPNEKSVQKAASWAIRNMVSRSKYQTKNFLELGAEEVLNECLKKFKDCDYDIKAALRDLGCDVQLKEEWTGKGGLLNSASRKKV